MRLGLGPGERRRRIRSDRFRLPFDMSFAVKRAVVRFAGIVWYLSIRGVLVRRGI